MDSERSPLLFPRAVGSGNASPEDDNESGESSAQTPKSFGYREVIVLFSIGILVFIQATNISILTTIQSAVVNDLDVYENANWLTSSYLVAMSSVTPLMGRLNQLFSPRLCISFATIIVSAGSTVISLATNFPAFIVGRVIAGVGTAGILVSITISIIQRTPHEKRGLLLGLTNTGMTVGVSLGAVVAGALEPKIGWHALFGVQAPISLIAGVILYYNLEHDHYDTFDTSSNLSFLQKVRMIDYTGALFLIATIVLFLFALSGKEILIAPLLVSFLAFSIFILVETSLAKEPIIPIMVLRSRGTLLTCIATVGLMMSRWAVLFYLPVYAIAVRELSPTVAGTILIPTNAGFATGGVLVGWLHIKREGSFFAPSLITMSLFPITMFGIAVMSTPTTPAYIYMLFAFANGLATGSALNYTLVHVLHLSYPSTHPIILSLLATFRGFAGSFGSAIGGGLFMRILIRSLEDGFESAGLKDRQKLIRKLSGSPSLVARLTGTEKEVAIQGYVDGLQGLFFGAVCLSALVVFIQAGAGKKAPQ